VEEVCVTDRCLGFAAAAACFFVVGAGACRRESADGNVREPVVHTVTIETMAFRPSTVTVRPGDRVVWVNKDFFPHTATMPGGLFDSGSIEPEASWTFTPEATGMLEYTCTFHPTMKATIRVE
jgi:plastocyanin